MKKILLSLSLLLTSSIAIFGQTDFNATDCAGAPHQLFSELDGGKVIVLVWVMPCSSCIPGAKAAYNASASFASSNPGRVFYYLIDVTGKHRIITQGLQTRKTNKKVILVPG